MTIRLDKWDLLDPSRFQRDVEEQHGGPVFDRWSILDPALERVQLNAALGLTLTNDALLDPWLLIQEVKTGDDEVGNHDLPDLPDGFSFVVDSDANYVLSGTDYVIAETPA